MLQFCFDLFVGRIGSQVRILGLTPGGETKQEWFATFNAKGFSITRYEYPDLNDPISKVLCGYESFSIPQEITDDEISLYDMINGPFDILDIKVMKLISLLCAQTTANYGEEVMHNTVKIALADWSDEAGDKCSKTERD